MKYLLPAVLFLSAELRAQHGFFSENINIYKYSDSINAGYLKPYTDGLGTLLVRGYVEGKLTGYKFSYSETPLKWAPLEKEYWPKPWDPREYYFLGDRVEYKGNGYTMMNEIGPSRITPDKQQHFQKFLLRGRAVSTLYTYPSMKDTLSRKEFLKNMIWKEQEYLTPWNPDGTYYEGDEVEFDGKKYEAIRDCPKGTRVFDKDYWQPRSNLPLYNSLTDLNGFTLIKYYEAKPDTTWMPQWISIRVYDQDRGFVGNEVVHLRYCDAINYLNSINQPALYTSVMGYIGRGRFLFDDNSVPEMLRFLRLMLRRMQITTVDIKDPDHASWVQFMNDPTVSEKCSVIQDLLTNDLVITKDDVAIARIPVRKILSLAQLTEPDIFTYSDGLELSKFNSYKDLLRIDSLSPLPSCLPTGANQKSRSYSWSEEYRLTDTDQVKEAWNSIFKARMDKRISRLEERLFDTINSASLNMLNRYSSDEYSIDESMCDSISFAGLSVIYERALLNGPGQFNAVEIKRYLLCGDSQYTDRFSWQAVKEILLKEDEKKYRVLIDVIESGKISVGRVKTAVGLTERR